MNRGVLAEVIQLQTDELHWRVKAAKLARRLGNNKPKSDHTIHEYQVGLRNARAHRAWAEEQLRATRRLL